MPNWETSTPIVARDQDWLPIEGQVGTVRTDQGLRVAVLLAEQLCIFVPSADAEFADALVSAVVQRQGETGSAR